MVSSPSPSLSAFALDCSRTPHLAVDPTGHGKPLDRVVTVSRATVERMAKIDIHQGDNAVVLPRLRAASFDLIYIDPPFNTGRAQRRTALRTRRDDDGDRVGFRGQRYRTVR